MLRFRSLGTRLSRKVTKVVAQHKQTTFKICVKRISYLSNHNLRVKRINFNSNKIFKTRFQLFSEAIVSVPNMGDSISEGTLVEWSKNVGDFCEVDEIVAVIETDKVSIDIRADQSGELIEQLANIDDTLEVGTPLFKLDTSKQGSQVSAQQGSPSTESTPPSKEEPKVQETAKKIDTPKPTPEKQIKSTDFSGTRDENRVPMSRMRLRIAERLKEAQTSAAALTTFNEIDMTNLINMRNEYKDIFLKKHGVKLGFMSAFVKASSSALLDIPAVNSFIDGKDFVYHNYTDISVAVASPTGLVVPVLRNVESMTFDDIELAIQEYANKAKNGTLSLDEMQGGTFTISNGGVFGSLMGTPILNPPQSAILGMHGTFERPVVIKGQIEVRPMMYVALTYDHRVVDGREAVLFLRRIKDYVEDPNRLLLGC